MYEVLLDPITTFEVLRRQSVFVASTNLSITLTHLEEYVEYNISVRAYTSVGPGPYSEERLIRTREDGQY